jgi:hypothetical protein
LNDLGHIYNENSAPVDVLGLSVFSFHKLAVAVMYSNRKSLTQQETVAELSSHPFSYIPGLEVSVMY